ncbi:MAG: C25 family cysteine peptidase [Euryarchaeota archaeon]|nr:C25 family cysteine peptidase [Euryarchaeota archaeon]
MRKMLPLCIVGILVLSGLGAVSVNNKTTNDLKIKTESIAISEPVIKDAGQYVTVSLKEAASYLLDSGKPMLPVLTKVFTFPFGTKISSVDVSFSETNELALSKEVKPATEPVSVDVKVANEPVKDSTVYGSAELYPANSYSYTTGAGLDGKDHVIYLAVQCYPVSYSPAKNMIYYSENAEIQVNYEEPATPTVFSDQYDLVIISPSEFSSALQPLIAHKNSMGVNTTLKTTEDIYSEYNGFDQAEKIKYFIKDAIETWGVEYVLLVGRVDKLPIRTTWFHERHHEQYWNETVLSDLYYADIYDANGDFCSWDSNGNGLYGEIYENCPGVDDIFDLYPDVNVGRLPCEKNAEVKTVVNKIINYETGTHGKSWFKNIILVGGDTFPGWGGNEGEEKNLITGQIMNESGFTNTTLWTSDGTFSARALNQALNRGAGFVDYSGHGYEIGIATHPPNSSDTDWVGYHTNNLLGALNGYKLPIIFFDACLTAKLDFNFSDLVGYASKNLQSIVNKFSKIASRLLPTFAWCMVKKSGGAIATIGATRTAFGGIYEGCGYLSLRFYEAYSTSETVSQMLTKAQNNYIANIPDDLFTVEEFALIGDPSLKIGGY